MARQSRLRIPGYPFHLTQRGHNKRAVFLDDTCFLVYHGLMGRMSVKHGCRIHAYVLMTNHVHMLVTGEGRDSISAMMKGINEQYGHFFNRRFARVGAVWQSRHFGSVVDSSEYLLTTFKYIDLNPVRAGMVERPRDYPWSSHRCHAEGESSIVVSAHAGYLALGEGERERNERYRRLFDTPIADDLLARIRSSFRSELPLGNDEFRREMGARFGVRTELSKPGPRKRDESIDRERFLASLGLDPPG
jgi:REP-associated tyrosine transposase